MTTFNKGKTCKLALQLAEWWQNSPSTAFTRRLALQFASSRKSTLLTTMTLAFSQADASFVHPLVLHSSHHRYMDRTCDLTVT
ncbi:hypothetical protein SLEP1_g54651 [Rubroshorea leprosula]|uniref:Uncharacterized protein n=1 Tax=Rubroshorea leprosula TaxID=152421 RepID=A0AAV5MF77_9ROSI|nr:hypothetical protein SLEP1_g54651 [Rubroshorea leprosula]